MVSEGSNYTIWSDDWRLYEASVSRGFTCVPVVVYLLVFTSNILVLATFKKMPSLNTQHYFMTGLACADLLTLVSHTTVIITLANGSILMTNYLCISFGVLDAAAVSITTWIQSSLCIDKCLLIAKPLVHKRFSESRLMRLKIIIFLTLVCCLGPLTIIISLISTNMMTILFVPSIPGCLFELNLKNTYLFTVIFVVGPHTIQIATSFCILIKVGRLRRRDRARILKATKTLAFTLGFYYLCWVPTVVETLLKTLGIYQESWYWLMFIAHNCIFLNSSFGFFIYYNTLPQFKKIFIEQVLGRRPIYVWPQRPTQERNK